MKVKPQVAPQVSAPRSEAPKAAPAAAPPEKADKGWTPATGAARKAQGADPAAARQKLAGLATDAVAKQIAAHANAAAGAAPSKHPLLEGFGEALGMGLGVVVTEALAALPSWNKPVLDAQGKPVASVEGANRVGNHDILKRHQEVVGPKVTELVSKLSPGAVHDLLEGLGKGATAAPGESYRLEAAVSDLFHKR
jgi:hypothetical protein